jgi:hypothetical protein
MPVYEERIVMFRATFFAEAIRKAEKNAKDYCQDVEATYLGFVEVFHLFERTLKEGSEVFSIMRSKKMPKEKFIRTYYEDGSFRRGAEPARKGRGASSPKPSNKPLRRTRSKQRASER